MKTIPKTNPSQILIQTIAATAFRYLVKWRAIVLGSLLCASANMFGQQQLPDLIVNRGRMARTLLLEHRTFEPSDCAVIEGCVRSDGQRLLLRFDIAFANVGSADLVLRNPTNRPALFTFSACHGHPHLRGMIALQLLKLDGRPVMSIQKRAFCIRDTVKYASWARRSRGYHCGYQGLTKGWQDIYFRDQECTWIDVTDVPAGAYFVKVTVNLQRRVRESNFGNNSATVRVRIPAQ